MDGGNVSCVHFGLNRRLHTLLSRNTFQILSTLIDNWMIFFKDKHTPNMAFGRTGLAPVGTRSHFPSWQWNPNSTEGSMYCGILIRIDQNHGKMQRRAIFLPDEQNLSHNRLFMSPTHLVTAIRPIDNQLVCALSNVKAPMNLQNVMLWGQKVSAKMKI